MAELNYCQLWLTCKDKAEADKIANTLLVKHLIACARQVPVSSNFWWQGKIDSGKEVLLIMESRLDLFEKVEVKVAKLHSYDTFVLSATPIDTLSKKAGRWLADEFTNEE
jgi:periplasmic divalent cation tolerance protein